MSTQNIKHIRLGIAALCLLCGLSLPSRALGFQYRDGSGEAPKQWTSLSISGYPTYSISGNKHVYGPSGISDIYDSYEGPSYTTGIFTFEYGLNFNRVFSLGIDAGFCPYWGTMHSGYTGEVTSKRFGCNIFVMPEAHLAYINRKFFRFFGTIGLGISLQVGDCPLDIPVLPMFQINPVCVEYGNKWFVLARLGVGTEFLGGKVGFGYRF
ncbi:MAG: hypothetical protein MJY62_06350 [Bacteroidales bacterium]|nr:hypothetical protein [Bacteroidales bacterium]